MAPERVPSLQTRPRVSQPHTTQCRHRVQQRRDLEDPDALPQKAVGDAAGDSVVV